MLFHKPSEIIDLLIEFLLLPFIILSLSLQALHQLEVLFGSSLLIQTAYSLVDSL
jgi:hypothetical protein